MWLFIIHLRTFVYFLGWGGKQICSTSYSEPLAHKKNKTCFCLFLRRQSVDTRDSLANDDFSSEFRKHCTYECSKWWLALLKQIMISSALYIIKQLFITPVRLLFNSHWAGLGLAGCTSYHATAPFSAGTRINTCVTHWSHLLLREGTSVRLQFNSHVLSSFSSYVNLTFAFTVQCLVKLCVSQSMLFFKVYF